MQHISQAQKLRSGSVEVTFSSGAVYAVHEDQDKWGDGWVADSLRAFLESGGEISPVSSVDPQRVRRVGTPREFLDLFTEAEKDAFFEARKQSSAFDKWITEAMAGGVSLDHPKIAPGLAALVAAQIITPDRMDEILAADFDNPAQGG